MKPRLAILFCLALVLVAFFCVIFQSRGQAFTPRRPFVLQSVSKITPPDISGGLRWWVSSDLAANAYGTNWPDRYASQLFTNTVAGGAPYNTTNGMQFYGTNLLYMQRATNTLGTTGSLFMIVTPLTPATTYGPIVAGGSQTYPAPPDGGKVIAPKGASGFYYWGGGGGGDVPGCHYVSGSTMDIAVVATIAGTGDALIYTNGLLCATMTGAKPIGVMQFMGKDINPVNWYKGGIREVFWATNILSATTISNWHWYGTNTYKYSP